VNRGLDETVIAVTATVVDAEAAVSLIEVAVMLTVVCPGATEAGAVYVVGVSLAVAAGETVPQAAAGHDTVQVTRGGGVVADRRGDLCGIAGAAFPDLRESLQ